MLEIGFLRENAGRVRDAIRRRGMGDGEAVDEILRLDAERRGLVTRVDELRHERKEKSARIGELRKKGDDATELVERVQRIKSELDELEKRLRGVEAERRSLLLVLPNVPQDGVPDGAGDERNVEVRKWGEWEEPGFEVAPHWEAGERLGMMDFKRGAGMAGSHFPLFLGLGARLCRALLNFMLEMHVGEHGYTEVWPPLLANRRALTGTGQLPKFEEDMYRTEPDDLFLLPTAEVPLTSLHAGGTLSFARLPLRYCAYTPCWRREAGAYGAKTRGLLRVHQFDKVELMVFSRAEQSRAEHERILSHAEEVLRRLGLVYRVVLLCAGELGFAAAKCYDIEVWAPGVGQWLEVSSVSNFEEFQARRLNIRYREPGGALRYCHTLNGSGVALARLVAAILEQNQNADGSVTVPEALRGAMGVERITRPL